MRSALHCLLLFSALWTLSFCGTRQFYLVNYNKTWTEAQKYCRENFTDLATIGNQRDMDTVKTTLNGAAGHFWIGLKQKISWIWSDGSNSSFRDWNTGEPNTIESENCIQLQGTNGYRWADVACHWPNSFVCYDSE
uniref:C-type lectin domain-containing protein n=1 Tax=Astyanax mexicanus TaxID=7994 RepID=A0A8B9R5I9_ASTMX